MSNVNKILTQLNNKTASNYKQAISPTISFSNADIFFHLQLSKYVSRLDFLPLQDYMFYVLQIYN